MDVGVLCFDVYEKFQLFCVDSSAPSILVMHAVLFCAQVEDADKEEIALQINT